MLSTLSRRLERLLRPQDTLSRISGMNSRCLLFSEREAEAITLFADGLRRALAAPLPYKDREIALTTSLGLALVDRDTKQTAEEFLRNAELAMLHAKRLGGDRIEVFKPSLRIDGRTGSCSSPICVRRSTATRSGSSSSRSFASRTARSPASRR